MGTITLDEEQKERAKELFHGLDDGGLDAPTDVVETWTSPENSRLLDGEDATRCETFIDPSKIEGPATDGLLNRLVDNRLKNVLTWLYRGEFEQKDPAPPMVEKRGDRYYVTDDGLHRCMAAKALNLDELYVVCEVIPPDRIPE